MRKYLGILALALVILFTAGCQNHFPNPKLTILDHSWTHKYIESLDEWRVEIMGTAINDGNRRLTYAEIKARIYMATDMIIGDSFTNIIGLNEGDKWHFEIVEYVSLPPYRYDVWVEEINW